MSHGLLASAVYTNRRAFYRPMRIFPVSARSPDLYSFSRPARDLPASARSPAQRAPYCAMRIYCTMLCNNKTSLNMFILEMCE